ncbi:putative kinase [Nakamurella sp. UYEF19]|uniref:AAA family ATPase n=1 Tax=Nakamurella sp. UYEF19 TaxID=1756392 RepID=UPI003397E97C
MHPPQVIVALCGLPGSGKSALAEDLARNLGAPILSVDPIESAMVQVGLPRSETTGIAAYVVAETLAAEQLAIGLSVVIDAVNDSPLARQQWVGLAEKSSVSMIFVEVRCSDPAVHRARLAGRQRDLTGIPEPDWASVQARRAGLEQWTDPRLIVDSMDSRSHNVTLALRQIGQRSTERD